VINFYLAVVIFLTMILAAFFSGSETAVVSCSKVRIRHRSKAGSRAARIVEWFLEKPEKFFSTVLVGTNVSVIVCTASATALAVYFLGSSGPVVATAVMTVVILVFSEVIPKSLFLHYADRIALLAAPGLKFFYYLLWPVVFPSMILVRAVLRLTGSEGRGYSLLSSREEIIYLYTAGKNIPVEQTESMIMDRILRFKKLNLRDIVIPFDRVVSFPVNMIVEDAIKEANKYSYYRFPVVSPDGEKVLGIISLFDLLGLDGAERLSRVMHPPLFARVDESVEKLLVRMKRESMHMAVIKDEEDRVIGIVTLENILESVVGNIYSEHEVLDMEG